MERTKEKTREQREEKIRQLEERLRETEKRKSATEKELRPLLLWSCADRIREMASSAPGGNAEATAVDLTNIVYTEAEDKLEYSKPYYDIIDYHDGSRYGGWPVKVSIITGKPGDEATRLELTALANNPGYREILTAPDDTDIRQDRMLLDMLYEIGEMAKEGLVKVTMDGTTAMVTEAEETKK